MEPKDWLLILAGGLLGYVTSLLATFTSAGIAKSFGKVKLGWIERNRFRALKSYEVVRELKDGKVDKYFYMLNSWGFVIVWLIFTTSTAVIGTNKPEEQQLIWAILSTIAGVLAFRRLILLIMMQSRIDNLEQYEQKLTERWPGITSKDKSDARR
jgi:hypothetical protein